MNSTKKADKILILSCLLISITIITSCNTYYGLSKKKIECYWKKEEKFKISKLNVKTLNEKGFPQEFNKEITYSCLTTNEVKSLQENKTGKTKFKPKRKIYFRKNNKYYKWCKEPCNSTKITNILPMKFEKKSWYELTGFPKNNFEGEKYFIYFYIDEKEKMKQHHVYKN